MRLTVKPTGELVDTNPDQARRYELDLARRAGLPEFQPSQLGKVRFGHVTIGGRSYRILTGHVDDPSYSPASAFYRDTTGSIVYLERVR